MNKIIFRNLCSLMLLWLIQGCGDAEETFTYYHFSDNGNEEKVITKVVLDDRVYFVNSYYNKKEKPEAYISPLSGLDNYYVCYLHQNGDEAHLITNMGEWQVVGEPRNFTLVEKPENFNEVTADKSGKYKLSTGNIKP